MGAYDSSKRIFYYDVLRALAIILIITSHICREFAKEWPVHSLKFIASAGWMDIAVLGVPIFLMLSGALLLNREYTLSDFFKRRYTRILIPFIFWALLLPIAKMIFLGEEVSFENYIDCSF